MIDPHFRIPEPSTTPNVCSINRLRPVDHGEIGKHRRIKGQPGIEARRCQHEFAKQDGQRVVAAQQARICFDEAAQFHPAARIDDVFDRVQLVVGEGCRRRSGQAHRHDCRRKGNGRFSQNHVQSPFQVTVSAGFRPCRGNHSISNCLSTANIGNWPGSGVWNQIPLAGSLFGDKPLANAENGFFIAKAHKAALDVLATFSGGQLNLVVLTGIKGSGKSALIGHWLDDNPGLAPVTRITADGRRPEAFLRQLAHRLRLEVRSQDADDVIANWRAALASAFPAGRAAILIIDNAERLDPDTAVTVKALASVRIGGTAVLRMLIAGRPEIAARFEPAQMSPPEPDLVQVALRNFDLDETKDFLGFLGQSPEKAAALHAATAGNPGRIVELILDRTDELAELRAALGPMAEAAKRPGIRWFESSAERKKRTALPVFDSENPRAFFRWGFGIAEDEAVEADEALRQQNTKGQAEDRAIGPAVGREPPKQPGRQVLPLVAGPHVTPLASGARVDIWPKDPDSVLRAVPDRPRPVAPFQRLAGTTRLQDAAMLRDIVLDSPATERRRPGLWLGFLTAGAAALIAAVLLARLGGETGDTQLAAAPQAAIGVTSGITTTDPPKAAGVSLSAASPVRIVDMAAPDPVTLIGTADQLPRRDVFAAIPASTTGLAPSSSSSDAVLQPAPQATISAKSGIFAPQPPTTANVRISAVAPVQNLAVVSPQILTELASADPVPRRQIDADIPPSDTFSAEGTDNTGYEVAFAVDLSDPEPRLPTPAAALAVNLAPVLVLGAPQPADQAYVAVASDPAARTAALAEQEQAEILANSTPSQAATLPPTNALRIEITPIPRDLAMVEAALDAAPGLGKLAEDERADLARMLADGTCVDQALREVTGTVNRHTLAALLHQMNLCSGE